MSALPPQNPQGLQSAAYITWKDATGAVNTLIFDLVESEDWEDGATVTEHPTEQGANVADNVRDELSKCSLKVFATQEPLDSNQWANASLETNALPLKGTTWSPKAANLDIVEWENNLEARVLIGTGAGIVGGLIGGLVGAGVGAIAGAALAGALLNGKKVHSTVKTNAGLKPPPAPGPIFPKVLTFDQGGDFVAQMVQQLLTLKKTAQLVDVIGTKQTVSNMAIDMVSVHRDADTGTGAAIALHFKEVRIVSTSTVPAPAPTLPRATAPASGGNQNTSDASPQQESVAHSLVN